MRKLTLPTVFFLFPLVAACTEAPTAPTDVFTPDDVAFAVKVVDFRTTTQLALTITDPCTGEDVDLTGTVRTKVTIWDNGHAQAHQDFDLDGTGQTSGAKYNVKQITNINIGPSGLPVTQRVQLNIVSAGSGDNSILDIHVHVDENGVVRVLDIDPTAKCVG